uniref:Uncharacterized protein n=1 Tax=Leersia perrieri TaxID=77586 RepID=A0A0D9VBR9_9ORYZ
MAAAASDSLGADRDLEPAPPGPDPALHQVQVYKITGQLGRRIHERAATSLVDLGIFCKVGWEIILRDCALFFCCGAVMDSVSVAGLCGWLPRSEISIGCIMIHSEFRPGSSPGKKQQAVTATIFSCSEVKES